MKKILCAIAVVLAFGLLFSCEDLALPSDGSPKVPSNLAAVPASETSVELSWTDNSDNETSFKLFRADSSTFSNYDKITLSANTVSYTDTSLSPGTTYYYRIAAGNDSGDSAYSSTATVTTPGGEPEETVVEVQLTAGYSHGSYKRIYAIWLANEDEDFYQNIFICSKVRTQTGLTNTGMPFWQFNVRDEFSDPVTEIDAVSGATIKDGDFTESVVLADDSIRTFTVFLEIDMSFDGNDWFSDQPAIIYTADIDLDNLETSYTMQFSGWTANEGTDGDYSEAVKGVMSTVLGYISRSKDNSGGFGDPDSQAATRMVEDLQVVINP